MFGYVTPCKMELKIKDYEKFKAYYCGLCKSIKGIYGNLPRLALNYDMTFLALLLDSLDKEDTKVDIKPCLVHPFKKRLYIKNNKALDYAARLNVNLMYYKILDDVKDDKKLKDKFLYVLIKPYIKKDGLELKDIKYSISSSLEQLSILENKIECLDIDSISHPFANLTGLVLSSYYSEKDNESEKQLLYWLGYNLGKWIYIIDAFDDLKKDFSSKNFNAIFHSFNKENIDFPVFYDNIKSRVEFLLTCCASQCLENLKKLNLRKNKELIYNIIELGLMEKMDRVFNPEKYDKNKLNSEL